MAFLRYMDYLEFPMKWFLDCLVFAGVVRKYSDFFFFVLWLLVTRDWHRIHKFSIFNACSIQNVEAASRVYFPLPDLSRKIERDSARRVEVRELQRRNSDQRTRINRSALRRAKKSLLSPWSHRFLRPTTFRKAFSPNIASMSIDAQSILLQHICLCHSRTWI